jgi:enoyl-CoA hydratase/carnithine racemase
MSFYAQVFTDLLLEKIDHTLWITLNRPQASNAYSMEMIKSLVDVLKYADEDQVVRVIVITGAGKNFCAGGDIKSMQSKSGMFSGESNELRETYQKGIQKIPMTISQMKKPLIAMINGAAVGAGCDLVAMCDLRIASEDSIYAETFAQVGLVPGDGGAYFLTRIIGYSKAMEMYLTCKTYSSSEAKEMGLVNEVVQASKLKEEVKNLTDKLASLPPIALQMTKKAVIHGEKSDLLGHLELMAAFQGITQRSSDHFKAIEGLLSKTKQTFHHL